MSVQPLCGLSVKVQSGCLLPLYWQSFAVLAAGYLECADLLLGAGSAVDTPTTTGATALHAAATNGHAAVVARLLDAGADPDVQVRCCSTSLSYHAWSNI